MITSFEPDASGTSGGGFLTGIFGGLGQQKATASMDVRVIEVASRKIVAVTKVQGEATSTSGLGGAFLGPVGGAMSSYANTPMEEAVTVMLNQAAIDLSTNIPKEYFKYWDYVLAKQGWCEACPAFYIFLVELTQALSARYANCMSLAYFIVVNHSDPDFDTFVNGKGVAKEAEVLNQLSAQLGATRLDEFLSLDKGLAEEFDIDTSNTPVDVWFEPEQGLKTIDTLITHLEQHPKDVKNIKGVLADLGEYQRVLNEAKVKGLQWHFELDF